MFSQCPALVFLTLCVVRSGGASKIVFESSPPRFDPYGRGTLSLHCGLNDTLPDSNSRPVAARDVTSTINNAPHVSSLMITRGDGTEVASVNTFAPAKPFNATWDVTVTGSVGSSAGERGFLHLTFNTPDQSAAGLYKCMVYAFDSHGHPIVYTQTLEVAATQPSINDMMNHLVVLETKLSSQEIMINIQDNMIKDLQSKASDQDSLIKDLKNQTRNQDDLIKDLQSKSSDQDSLNKDLKNQTHNQNSMIKNLQNQNSNQDSLINDINNYTSHQDSLIKNLQNQTSRHDNLIKNLQNQTSHQDSLFQSLQSQPINQSGLINDLQVQTSHQDSLIKNLQNQTSHQDSLMKDLKNLTNHEDDLILSLQTQLSSQDDRITLIQNSQTTKFTDIMNTISESQHIERGLIDCSLPHDNKDRKISHWFKNPYTHTPDVTLSISSVKFYDSTYNNDYKDAFIDLDTVTTHGFIVRCHTSSYFANPLQVTWISFPN